MYHGAAPLKNSTIDFFAALDMQLMTVYGLSETTGGITFNCLTNCNLHSAGQILPGYELYIHNPDSQGIGEIVCRGRCNFLGYLGNEKATTEVVRPDGFFHTGD